MAERRPLPEAPVAENELIDELEGSLAAARDQLRLLRGSLATLIGFLERPPG